MDVRGGKSLNGPWRFYFKLACLAVVGWVMLGWFPDIARSVVDYRAADAELNRCCAAVQSLETRHEQTLTAEERARLRAALARYISASADLSHRLAWVF